MCIEPHQLVKIIEKDITLLSPLLPITHHSLLNLSILLEVRYFLFMNIMSLWSNQLLCGWGIKRGRRRRVM